MQLWKDKDALLQKVYSLYLKDFVTESEKSMFTPIKLFSRRKRLILGAGLVFVAALISFAAFDLMLNKWPDIGAQGADWLRSVIGDKAVAFIESTAFQTEDIFHRWKYQLTGATPVAPWNPAPPKDVAVTGVGISPSTSTSSPIGVPPSKGGKGKASNALITNGFNSQFPKAGAQSKGLNDSPGWVLPSITPLGTVSGEGQWSPFLSDASGQVVAERTFLQPDPQRPYALVAVIAFDLSKTSLHFVLGTIEPKSPVTISRPGTIPSADIAPGILVAAFNGGFKAQHGHFGVMVDNTTVIPPRDGMGTLGIYSDGQVQIGAWGTDITPSPQLIAWRQNGPLIIQNGQINPHTADYAPQDWGYTVAGSITTPRSAIGISQDGRTLFYAAGPYLTLPALARALQAAGAYQAMQLDINNYYVHFEAISFNGNVPQATPLLDFMHGSGDGRFLKPYPRDFFYITTK